MLIVGISKCCTMLATVCCLLVQNYDKNMKFTVRIFLIHTFQVMMFTFYHKVKSKTVMLTQGDILVE